MSRIIAYLRVSSEEQALSGLGIEAQLEAIRAKVGEPDIIIRDEGFSGGILNRPGLTELLQIVGKGDTIAIAKLDRLSRGDSYAAAWLEKELTIKGKVKIISAAGEGTGDNSPQGALMREILKAFANFELSLIKQRTSAAVKVKMERKKQAGEKTGGRIPFGYAVSEVDGVKMLVDNPTEQAAIKIMVAMRAAGATLQSIADHLHDQGILPRAGGKWAPTVIRSIINRANSIVGITNTVNTSNAA